MIGNTSNLIAWAFLERPGDNGSFQRPSEWRSQGCHISLSLSMSGWLVYHRLMMVNI